MCDRWKCRRLCLTRLAEGEGICSIDKVQSYEKQIVGVGNQTSETRECSFISQLISIRRRRRSGWTSSTWSGTGSARSMSAWTVHTRSRSSSRGRLLVVSDSEQRRQKAHRQIAGRHLHTTDLIIILGMLNFTLAGCLIYAEALLEYLIFIMWLRSVTK